MYLCTIKTSCSYPSVGLEVPLVSFSRQTFRGLHPALLNSLNRAFYSLRHIIIFTLLSFIDSTFHIIDLASQLLIEIVLSDKVEHDVSS